MTSIIFQNVLDNVYKSTNNINSFFDNYDKYNTNLFNLFNLLPKKNLIIYIFIVFIVFRFISFYKLDQGHIFSLLVVCIIIYFMANKDYFDFMEYTNSKKDKLNFLHKLMYDNMDIWTNATSTNLFVEPVMQTKKSYLYLNPPLVDVFIDIKNVSSYNISSYVDALIHCNNVIGINYQAKIGLNRSYLNYDTAILEKNKALNSLNSAIYDLPEGTIPKFMDSIKKIHSLLNEHLREIGNCFKNDVKLNGLRVDRVPDDLYDVNFIISPDDTKTRNYISTYNMYC